MYRSADAGLTDKSVGPVIALGRWLTRSELVISVDPDWRSSVRPQDAPAIDEILKDLAERARTHPEALWKQIRSLNWGILVTGECGEDTLNGFPMALKGLDLFEPLS